MKRKALALCMALTTLLASASLMQAGAAGEANTLPKLEGKMLDDGTKADKWIINGAAPTVGDNCVEGKVSTIDLGGPQGWMYYWSTGKDEGIDMTGYKYLAIDMYVSDTNIFGISGEPQSAQCFNFTNDFTGTKWDSYGSVNGADFVDATKDVKVGWNRFLFPLDKLTKGITYEDGSNAWSSENGVDITNVQYLRMLILGPANMPAEGATIKLANMMLTNGEEAGGNTESQPSTPESKPESKPSPSTSDTTGPVAVVSVAALAVLSLGAAVAVKKKSR